MKLLRHFFIPLALLLLCGCMGGTSITAVDPVPKGTSYQGRKVLGIIRAENRGIFLFYGIPIWTGRPTSPNFRQYAMFRNYLKTGYMDQMLEYEGRLLEAKKIAVVHASEQASATVERSFGPNATAIGVSYASCDRCFECQLHHSFGYT